MPPILALLMCTAFVFYLLWLEKRGSHEVSAAMWVPTLWMLIAASRPLGTWFIVQMPAHMQRHNEAGSPLDRWTLVALGIAAIIVLIGRRFDWRRALRQHRWVMVLLAYMFVSTFWSDITLIALKRWSRELIVVLVGLVIVSEVNPQRALASLMRRCAYVLLPFSVVLIKYYPLLGRQYAKYSGVEMWTGATAQKNELGRLCMISIFFMLWAFYDRRSKRMVGARYQKWGDLLAFPIALYLLIGAHSATSIATLCLGAAVFWGMQRLKKMRIRIPEAALLGLVIFVAAYGIAVPFMGGSNVASFTGILGRDDTLTGRTEVWAAVLPEMERQPLLGHGFGSFWTDARREQYDIPTAHNGYLDVLLELGSAGLALFVAWLLSSTRQLHRALAHDYQWPSFAICLLLMSLIYNATESALNSLTEYMTAVVVLACFAVPAAIRATAAAAVAEPAALPSLRLGEGLNTVEW